MVGGVTALPAGWDKMPRGLAGVGRAGLPDGFESRKVRSSHAVFQVQVSLSAHPLRCDDVDVARLPYERGCTCWMPTELSEAECCAAERGSGCMVRSRGHVEVQRETAPCRA